MNSELTAFFERVRPAIDATLDRVASCRDDSLLHEFIRRCGTARWTAANGSDPALCVAAFAAYKDDWKPILPVASAIEMIHAYSLIHDDLPAMDDDDFRRGKPSCHKQFDEAIAILAGDALLTLAFEVLAHVEALSCRSHVEGDFAMLGAASGSRGDDRGPGPGSGGGRRVRSQPEQLETIHRSKTGALIGAAVWIGAFLGGASGSGSWGMSERIAIGSAWRFRLSTTFSMPPTAVIATKAKPPIPHFTVWKNRARSPTT